VGVVYFLITLFVSGDLYLAVKPAKPTLPAKPLPPKPLPAGPAADKISNISDSTLVRTNTNYSIRGSLSILLRLPIPKLLILITCDASVIMYFRGYIQFRIGIGQEENNR